MQILEFKIDNKNLIVMSIYSVNQLKKTQLGITLIDKDLEVCNTFRNSQCKNWYK